MTAWERMQARQRDIKRRTRWQDRRLDEGAARAVEAVLNGPRPPRAVAALAVRSEETPDGWAVVVQHAEGTLDVERLTTLGQCAPYLGAAMRAPWTTTRATRLARHTGLAQEVPASPGAEREVREALGAVVGDAEGQPAGVASQAPTQREPKPIVRREGT